VSQPPRLGRATLDILPADLRPPLEGGALRTGMVHLGLGHFHRAHQAVLTEAAMAASGERSYGIAGVSERSPDAARRLAAQDGFYSLHAVDPDADHWQVVGVHTECLFAGEPEGARRVAELLADPAVSVVTLTVTEKGYRLRPGTSGLDLDDPALRGDLEVLSARAMGPGPGDEVLRTPIGQLLHGVWWRVQAGGPPLTVLSCDNLRDNGGLVRRLLEEGAGALADPVGGRLSAWMSEGLATPSTMVDRMVPKAGPAEEAAARTRLGLLDLAPVLTEGFLEWVIEDRFAGPRPSWDTVGARLVADVQPYESAKLRLLNAGHSLLAYLGLAAGRVTIADAVAVSGFARAAARLMADDAAPTIDAPRELDLDRYREQCLRRMGNGRLGHAVAQVAMDGSQKLPERLGPTIVARRATGEMPLFALLALAAWIRLVWRRTTDSGESVVIDDPLADRLAEATAGCRAPEEVVRAALVTVPVLPAALLEDRALLTTLADLVDQLDRAGAERTATLLAG